MSAPEPRPRPRPRDAKPPPWLLCALLALVYLILAPQSPDLAAASYRSHLFARVGFTLWDNSWYGGHHLPAYSLLAPALGALIGPALLAALSMVAATALFSLVLAGRVPERAAWIASVWFAFGAGVALLSSRVPFDLGLAIGLGSVALAQRERIVASALAAMVCSVASPVAGAFLAMAMLAWAIAAGLRSRALHGDRASRSQPRPPEPDGPRPNAAPPPEPSVRALLTLCVLALTPIGFLTVVFPEGGSQPFVASAFWPALAGVIAIGLLLPAAAEQRVLRIGALLYALVLIGSFLVPSAVGGNADRLGALAAGPIAACALACSSSRGRRRALIALVLPLAYWQVNAPVTDFVSTVGNPATRASYYAPLLGELAKLDVGYGRRPARVEVVPTVDHWEARYVAPAVMIARGWERQLDRYRNALFYGRISAADYGEWLIRQGIDYVALPDASLDYSGKAEKQIVEALSRSRLREAWSSAHWRLFAVETPTPLAQPPATLQSASTDSFTLRAPGPGSYRVLIRFTPYWAISDGSGCVAEAPGGWTEIHARAAGPLRVSISFSLARIFSHGARCD